MKGKPKARSEGSGRATGLPAPSPAIRSYLLKSLLKRVSRAFYLTLGVLPRDLREPVGLAYLLARAADTIADTRALPPDQRLLRLLEFREQLQGHWDVHVLLDIGELAGVQSTPTERELLRSLPQAFAVLESLSQADGDAVRAIVATLTRGMEMDLTTFPAEESGEVRALETREELDRYTYYVAGCVGEFWTGITKEHSPSLKGWDVEGMSGLGVRFGKALQLTNVLRDVPRDLRIGRCYLPKEELARAGLRPEELLEPSAGAMARPVLVRQISAALEHYQAAEEYVLAIPRRSLRLRLAALWPVLIGLATLYELARNEAWLDPERRSKVGRRWVYRMMALSVPCALSNTVVRLWIGRLRRGVEKAL